MPFGLDNLAQVRASVHDGVRAAGLCPDKAMAFAIAVSEAMTNAIVHGGDGRTIVVRQSGRYLRADVHDNGVAPVLVIPDQPPPPDHVSGRGLWLMSQYADKLTFVSDGDGTTVYVQVARDDSADPTGE
jgi:anti-sigma regulatory factor (Ser/Thr protein kinase)